MLLAAAKAARQTTLSRCAQSGGRKATWPCLPSWDGSRKAEPASLGLNVIRAVAASHKANDKERLRQTIAERGFNQSQISCAHR